VIALSETQSGGTVAASFHNIKVNVFEEMEDGVLGQKALQTTVLGWYVLRTCVEYRSGERR
jgi:hypothetical protein